MAISDKLNYLIETKQLFKDRLNSLGAEIIESTTFRNYLNWLDTFYNQSSDKTDLAKNGIVGRTSQDGDPTPENPVEINNLSGNVEYKVSGKNLFDKNNANIIKCGISYHKINASDSNRLLYISIQPNTTYTIQRRNDGNVNRFRAGTCSIVPANGVDLDNAIETDDAKSITITSRENDTYLAVMYYRTQETTLTEQQILDSIQIEEGSTATTYEPYISESFPLSLGDIELCNISDYKDRIYSQNGEFYLEKKTGKVVLDGSENWVYEGSSNRFCTTVSNSWNSTSRSPIISNYFIYVSSGNPDGGGFNYNQLIYLINHDYSTTDTFKTWLSTHNTTVYYVLATPTTTEITEENYPTLYSQLLAIQEFLTKYKINKEFLLDYSSPEIEY